MKKEMKTGLDAGKQADTKQYSMAWWLACGRELLSGCGIEDAGTDARLLMEHVTGLDGSALYLHMQECMTSGQEEEYEKLLARRAKRVPLQHLTGEAWFYGLSFEVNSTVLIPRQDTEILVEEAQRYLKPGMRILDLCTGSGCILIALLKQMPLAGTGTDLSGQALETARRNAARHEVEAVFEEGDLFEAAEGRYDLIVSNPPYIPTGEIAKLQPEVRDHDPGSALDGGPDGLVFYRRIAQEAASYLNPGGRLCVEIGYDQGAVVRELFLENGWQDVRVIKDYAGLDRVVSGKKDRVS